MSGNLEECNALTQLQRRVRALQAAAGVPEDQQVPIQEDSSLWGGEFNSRVQRLRGAVDDLNTKAGLGTSTWRDNTGNWSTSASQMQNINDIINGVGGGGVSALERAGTTRATTATGVTNYDRDLPLLQAKIEERTRATSTLSGPALTRQITNDWNTYRSDNGIRDDFDAAAKATNAAKIARLLAAVTTEASAATAARPIEVDLRGDVRRYVTAANPGMTQDGITSQVNEIIEQANTGTVFDRVKIRATTDKLTRLRTRIEEIVNRQYENQEVPPTADRITQEVAGHMTRIVGNTRLSNPADLDNVISRVDAVNTDALLEERVRAPSDRREAVSDYARATGMDERALARMMSSRTPPQTTALRDGAAPPPAAPTVLDRVTGGLLEMLGVRGGAGATPEVTARTGPRHAVNNEDLKAAATKIDELKARFVAAATRQPTTGPGRLQPPAMNEEQAGRAFDDMVKAQNRTNNLLLVNTQGMANLENGVAGVESGRIQLRAGMTAAQIAAGGQGQSAQTDAPTISAQVSTATGQLMNNLSSGNMTRPQMQNANQVITALNGLAQAAQGLEGALGTVGREAMNGRLTAEDMQAVSPAQQLALRQLQLIVTAANMLQNVNTRDAGAMRHAQQQFAMLNQQYGMLERMKGGASNQATGMSAPPINITGVQVGGAGLGANPLALGSFNTPPGASGIMGGTDMPGVVPGSLQAQLPTATRNPSGTAPART